VYRDRPARGARGRAGPPLKVERHQTNLNDVQLEATPTHGGSAWQCRRGWIGPGAAASACKHPGRGIDDSDLMTRSDSVNTAPPRYAPAPP
jgi:hypothetical protein